MANKRFSIETVFTAIDKVTAPISRMQTRMEKFTHKMRRDFRRVNNAVSAVTKGIGGIATAAAKKGAVGLGVLGTAAGLLVREFTKVEDAEAAFTPLMKGAEGAKKLVEALNETAATTPFQFEGLANVTRILLPAMNSDIDKTIKTIRMLGDSAGGDMDRLTRLTSAYTKTVNQQVLQAEEMNSINDAGVPIYKELAKSMGVNVITLKAMRKAGMITAADLEKMFQDLTSEGGLFFRGMEIASQTTTGVISTMLDNISRLAAELGSTLAPVVQDVAKHITELAKQGREWVLANKPGIIDRVTRAYEGFKNTIKTVVERVRELNEKYDLVDIFFKATEVVIKFTKYLSENGEVVLKAVTALATFVVALQAIATAALIIPVLAKIAAGFVAVLGAAKMLITVVGVIGALFVAAFGPVVAGVLAVGAAAFLLIKYWEPIKEFFKNLWDGIANIFDGGIGRAMEAIKRLAGSIGKAFSFSIFSDDDIDANGGNRNVTATPQAMMPAQTITRSLEETRTSHSADVTIKDETGRAEVSRGNLGAGLVLEKTGSFD